MSPGTEFARDFCAGIGPLQLGVVLVSINFITYIRGSMSCFKTGPLMCQQTKHNNW